MTDIYRSQNWDYNLTPEMLLKDPCYPCLSDTLWSGAVCQRRKLSTRSILASISV